MPTPMRENVHPGALQWGWTLTGIPEKHPLETLPKPNVEEICANAISAGTHDPRFAPVGEDELDDLVYDVDVLGEPEPVASTDELDPARYGVIVSCGGRRGLLLPDLDGVDTVEEQVSIAARKGGIDLRYDDYRLERFEVVRHL